MSIKSAFAKHIETMLYVMTFTTVIGFGCICFGLGRLDA